MKNLNSIALAAAAVLLSGCASRGKQLARTHNILTEESRALTTAVVEVLQEQPAEQRDTHTATALLLAKQDQRVEGLPAQPIDTLGLLQTNAAAQEALAERFALQNKRIALERNQRDALVALGVEKDLADRARRARWFKWSGLALGSLGTLICIVMFCPLLVPFIGRAIGWFVSLLPGMARAFGVVSVKAFDSVVRGIEKTKQDLGAQKPTILVPNTGAEPESRRASREFVELLQANLSREMDVAHKALVRSRKTTLA